MIDSDCGPPVCPGCLGGETCTGVNFNYHSEVHPLQAVAVSRIHGYDDSKESRGGGPATRTDVWISPNGGGAGDKCIATHQASPFSLFAVDCYPLSQPLANVSSSNFEFDIPLLPRPPGHKNKKPPSVTVFDQTPPGLPRPGVTTTFRRADAFAFAVSQKGVEDGTFWSAKASDYLRGYFCAAALARYDLRTVASWVAGANPDVPERTLLAAGACQWAHTLAELRSEAHKTAATVRMVMSRSLAFMADPALAASVLPGPGDGFDIPAFLEGTGTVYLIAEAVSEEAPVAPLFAAMATEIHWVAAQLGQASPSGRLDPTLLMGLDEVTQICPVPLPHWLSDSGGKGIQVCAVVHGEAQLAGRWGDYGRQVVLDTSSVKVFLPGITDTTTLQAASTLCGQASWKVRGQDHATRHDVATPDMIRQLPAGFALVIRGGCAPVIARLPRAWKNPAYRRARRLGQAPAELAEAEWPEPDLPDYVPAEWLRGDGTTFPWS